MSSVSGCWSRERVRPYAAGSDVEHRVLGRSGKPRLRRAGRPAAERQRSVARQPLLPGRSLRLSAKNNRRLTAIDRFLVFSPLSLSLSLFLSFECTV